MKTWFTGRIRQNGDVVLECRAATLTEAETIIENARQHYALQLAYIAPGQRLPSPAAWSVIDATLETEILRPCVRQMTFADCF